MSIPSKFARYAPLLTALAGLATIISGGDMPGTRKAWETLSERQKLNVTLSRHLNAGHQIAAVDAR